ncbi:MAG: tRNA guanosine(34) transglycosylase Tgt [Candidatus Eremiobacteraeota bacterium]|nr:tRNA guanosine(34) transglycosylase Tgt [Candidatus Eremiobacteraeota bacterium]
MLHGTCGAARRGTLRLGHGEVQTPAFMPVGTAATVKGLTPDDLQELSAEIILANTYHLWLRPGLQTIVDAGGLHEFMQWHRPILTDSGGFQVFSLQGRRTLNDQGVTFASHIDGSQHLFTPELVVAFQEAIGADIAMVLDVCIKLPASKTAVDEAVRVTSHWAQRAQRCWQRSGTLLFAVMQGGLDEDARQRSAEDLRDLDFPGYAIGGLSVGESREDMRRIAHYSSNLLPHEKPRYLMGVGTVPDLIHAVDCGIDLFDCVYPTRCGRNGRALTRRGELNIRNVSFARDFTPLDAECLCSVCRRFSRAYLCHLFRADEMLGPRLLSYHNLFVLTTLMSDARAAILDGTWYEFKDAALAGVMQEKP